LAAVLRRLRRSNQPRFTQLENALNAVIPQVSEILVQQVGSFLSIRLVHNKKEGKAPTFDLGLESDGTIRALALLTALYNNRRANLLAIEEPELAIHPGAARVIAEVIKEAALTSQVMITTHDPDLLDWFEPKDIRVVNMVDGETKVGQISAGVIDQIRRELTSPGELLKLGILSSSGQQAIDFTAA